MAADWGTAVSSTALTLTGSYATVQHAAADLEIEVEPNEVLHALFDFDPQAAATEDGQVEIQASPDASNWDTDDNGIMAFTMSKDDDPSKRSVSLFGHRYYRFRAKVVDTDGTAGGDDTTSTLTVHYALGTMV